MLVFSEPYQMLFVLSTTGFAPVNCKVGVMGPAQ